MELGWPHGDFEDDELSPTYWTATLLIRGALANGWTIRGTPGCAPWSMHKNFDDAIRRLRIEIKERRDGAITWCTLTRTFEGGFDVVRLGHDHRGKRDEVLSWLQGNISWPDYGLRDL
jgi:hypothetical protein